MSDGSNSSAVQWDDQSTSGSAQQPTLQRGAASSAAPLAQRVQWDDPQAKSAGPQLKRGSTYSVMDPVKELGAGALEGVGSLVSGIGGLGQLAARPIVAGVNALAGPDTLAAPINAFKPIGDAISGVGKSLHNTESDEAKAAGDASIIQGDILHPSTLTLGEGASSPKAWLQSGANLVGQAAPLLIGGLESGAAKGASYLRTLGTGAAIGGLQGAQGSADSESARIQNMSDADLAALPEYQSRIQAGMTPAAARSDLADKVSQNSFAAALPVATAAGLVSAVPFMRGAQEKLAQAAGTSMLKRMAAGAAIEAPAQGAIGVAQNAAQTAGANAATGEDRSLTDNSVGAFGGGAIAGGAFGAVGAVLHHGAQVPHPDAKPGSLADAANAIAENSAAPPAAEQPASPAGQPASQAAPDAAAPRRAEPVVPAWVNQETGEVGAPTADLLANSIAQQMMSQHAIDGSLRINSQALADAWNVPVEQVKRARGPAQKLASDQIASAERDAMAQPSTPADAEQAGGQDSGQADNGTVASMPVMITQAMKGELRALGHSDSDIAKMTPQQAHDLLRAGERVLGPSRDLLGESQPAVDQAIDQANEAAAADDQAAKPAPDAGAAARDEETTPQAMEASEKVAGETDEGQQPAQEPETANDAAAPSSDETATSADSQRTPEPATPDDSARADDAAGKAAASDQPIDADRQQPTAPNEAGAGDYSTSGEQSASSSAAAPAAPDAPKRSAAYRDAETMKVDTPDGKVTGRQQVDDLLQRGYSDLKIGKDAGKLTYELRNDKGEGQPIKARQVTYAQEAIQRSRAEGSIRPKNADVSSRAARDAEGMRVKMPGGEMTGRAHVDQLLRDGFSRLESMPAGNRLVHKMFNSEGESQQIKARQLPYAKEAVARAEDARVQAEHQQASAKVESAAGEAALSPHNDLPEPTEAQKEAGNYKKGHVNLQGLDISIENPRGSTRSGVGENGKPWSHEMSDHYGYIKRTEGADGEHVDVYVGPHPASDHVYVVDQLHQKSGGFDEHKAMLGFTSEADAVKAYRSNFEKGWKVGPVSEMSMDGFKAWLKDGDTTKPASERHSPSAPGNKVVDEKGDPLTVYHGTREPFSGAFDQSRSKDAGVWFTPEKGATAMYGDHAVPAHVRLENPYEAKVGDSKERSIEKATDGGHDGIIVRDGDGKISTLSVFDSRNIQRLDEENPAGAARFSRANAEDAKEAARSKAHTDQIQKATDEITGAWKGKDVPEVKVVATPEDLPSSAKRNPDTGLPDDSYRDARGMYDGDKIYVVASKHEDTPEGRAALRQTVLHEAVGHYGVDRIVTRELGAGAWEKITSSIERLEREGLGGKGTRDVLADVRRRYGDDMKPSDFARETLAVMAERGVRNGLLDRVVSAVRSFVRRIMPDLKLSEGELRQLLARSDEYLQRGRAYADQVADKSAVAFSRDGWDEDFPNVVTGHQLGVLREHPDYAAAKAGDRAAALRVARDIVTPEFVQKVRNSLPDGSKPIVVPVNAREASGRNEIPNMAAAVLADRLGLPVDRSLVQAEKVSRGGSDAMHRIANQPAFDGKVQVGKDYLLLDDTLTQGGTLAQLKTKIERDGGRVVLATALTGKDYSRKLALSNDTLSQVRERFGNIEDWWEKQFGYGFDGLTESEARTILTYDKGRLSPDGLRDRIAASRIPGLRGLGEGAAGDRPGTQAPGTAGRVTDAPAFRDFFGKSKVVESDGSPQTVYHGTGEDFAEFSTSRAGDATGHDTSPLGHFFTEDRALADRYAENASEGRPADKRVVDAYLRVEKPYRMSLEDAQAIQSPAEARALRERLQAQGYDGIRIPESKTWIAFDSEQIKSATQNRGTFDPTNRNIYFSKDVDDSGDPIEPTRKPRPFGKASESIEAINDQLPKLDESAFQRAKDWIAGKARDFEPAALGGLQLRHLLELAGDEKVLERPAKAYADLFQRMDGDRNNMTQEGADKAQKLQQWAFERGPAGWRGKLKPEAQALFKFMHEVTQVSVDPTNAYERLLMRDSRGEQTPWTEEARKERIKALRNQIRGRSGDDKTAMMDEIKDLQNLPARERARQEKYPELVAKWNALTPQAHAMFDMMRDHYSEQSRQLEEAAQARIDSLDIPAQNKAAAKELIKRNFEDAKVGGVYFPLMRFGDYWISARKPGEDGDYVFGKYETAAQAADAEKRMRAANWEVEATGRQDQDYKAKQAPSGTFMGELMDTLRKGRAPDGVMDDIYQLFLKTLPEMSLRKSGIHRKNVAGYSDNVPRAFSSSVFHGAHQISKARYGYQLQNTLEHMSGLLDARRTTMGVNEAAHADALLGELSRRHQWIMSPTNSQLASKLTSIGFIYHLAASPASALTNLLQVPQIVLPVLGAHHGWPAAMKVLGSTMKDAFRTGGNIDRALRGEELMAFKALQQQGTFQRTATHTLAGLAEGGQLKASPTWAKAMNAISWMFHKSEVINREGTGMAAYRLARAEGKSFEQAVRYADQITNGTHGDYSNANRARYMQGNVAKIAFQFKNYSLAMSWLWGRNLHQALKGETPEVRQAARRTFTGLMGMTGLMAGAMGLPIINLLRYGSNAVHAVTGDPDEPYDFNTEFESWLDDHLGKTAGSIIAHGAANQLGADVASRTSMSDLWFRDADRQLEGADAYDNYLESIAGPIGGLIKNMFVGTQQFNEGHTWRGIETMMPTAAKNAMKAMRFAATGEATNLKGDPILPDVSKAEDLIQALGFSPTRLSDQQRVNSALMNYSEAISSRRQSIINAYAMATNAGDEDGRSDVVEQIRSFNQKYPQAAIRMSTLADSMRTRARNSAQAENGIVLQKRLAGAVRDAVGSMAD